MARVQVKVRCPACEGRGSEGSWYPNSYDFEAGPCSECEGEGEVLAKCIGVDCGQPAFVFVPPPDGDAMCFGCASICSVCETETPATDRLPWGELGAVIHASCALAYGALLRSRGLEITVVTEDAVLTRAHALTRSRALLGGPTVPKPSDLLVETMRRDGYIPTSEAVQLSGHSLSAIYEWISTGRLRACKSGIFHFVERTSLEECCPQVRAAS